MYDGRKKTGKGQVDSMLEYDVGGHSARKDQVGPLEGRITANLSPEGSSHSVLKFSRSEKK